MPGEHGGQDPVTTADVPQEVRGTGFVEDEKEIRFPTHDDQLYFCESVRRGEV